MSQDIAARLPLLGAFGLRRRVVGRCGRPACLALITALLPGAGLAIAVAGCGGQAPVSLPHKSSGAAVPVALTVTLPGDVVVLDVGPLLGLDVEPLEPLPVLAVGVNAEPPFPAQAADGSASSAPTSSMSTT